jgi:hypothetical protein
MEVENAKAGFDGAFPSDTQTAFLLVEQEREHVLFGGAAGGGKSSALLAGGLQYVDLPGYAAVLFRRKFVDLERPDGLIPRSHQWLSNTDAHWSGDTRTWRFPSGSTLGFGYLDHLGDEERWQGAAAHYWGFDEAGQFAPSQLQYLTTRARRLKGAEYKHPIRFRYSANPGGEAHQWLHLNFIVEGAARGNLFIPSLAKDNPGLDLEDYLQRLEKLSDPVLKAQLLHGDWSAIDRSNAIVPEFTPEVKARVVREDPRPARYQPYTVQDVGSRDLFVALFSYLDFVSARIHVLDELVLRDPSTDEIGEGITKKYRELYGTDRGALDPDEVSDVDHRLARDLRKFDWKNAQGKPLRLTFRATAKDDALAARNAARAMVGQERVIISPRCKVLIATLEGATWNDKRTDYARTEELGHADAWDTLVYLCRNVRFDANPFPVVAVVPGTPYQDIHGIAPARPVTRNLRALQGAFRNPFLPK